MGPAVAGSLSTEGTIVDFKLRESRWAASQHLKDGRQFGSALPFDLFFSLLMFIFYDLRRGTGFEKER